MDQKEAIIRDRVRTKIEAINIYDHLTKKLTKDSSSGIRISTFGNEGTMEICAPTSSNRINSLNVRTMNHINEILEDYIKQLHTIILEEN